MFSNIKKSVSMSTTQAALQQPSQRNCVGVNRAASTRYDETNERLEEFVRYFVKESEAKFNAYHLILEEDNRRSGKFTQAFSEVIGYGMGGAIGMVAAYLGLPAGTAKCLSSAGKSAGQKISNKIGCEKYAEGVRQLADLVKLSQKSKATFRKDLVETGFDIFQSFEMQFMGISVDESPGNAMRALAEDAINRAVNYLKKNQSAPISEAVLLGESKRKDVGSISPGFAVIYKSQACNLTWNTASLYSKVGLLKVKDGQTYFFRKKKSNTGKYGYRRLLEGESWDVLSQAYKRDNIAESHSGHFTNYDYILHQKDMEVKCENILKTIDSGDKDLAEARFKELLVDVKNDILEEINELKTQTVGYPEDHETLLNLEESVHNFDSEELLKKLKQCLSENTEEIGKLIRESSVHVAQSFKTLSDDNSQQHGKTQAAVERVTDTLEMIQKGQERGEQTLQQIVQKLDKNARKACENDNTARHQRRRNKDPIWFDMRDPIKSFTGRQNHLDQIAEWAKNGMVVITGLSGVGKTELAIKYARTHYKSDSSVLWINAKNRECMKHSFHRLCERLQFRVISEDGTENDLKSISEDVYGHFSSQKSLFIFDDVENYATIKDVLPRGLPPDANKPLVLITCHKLEVERGMTLRLGDFTADESMDFIKQFLSVKGDSQIVEIRQLAKKVHNFPLALQQAVAYILEEDKSLKNVDPKKEFTIKDYLEEFDRETEELLKCEVFQKLESDYDKTTFTALQITLSKIKNQKNAERVLEILNIMSYFSPENIPASFFLETANGNARKLGAIIQLLKDYSIVSGEGHLNMHGLVQQVKRLELKEKEGGSVTEEIILRKTLEMLKKYMTDYRTIRQYISHITSVWNHASKYNSLIASFLFGYTDDSVPYTTYFHVIMESSPFNIVADILQKIEEHFSEELNKVINQKCSTGATPLYYAAMSGDERKVKLLMNKGASIDFETNRKLCLLHVAAKNGYLDTVKYLLQKRVNISPQSEYKFTPLHLAIKGEHLEIINLLLSHGASVAMKTSRGFRPLHLAAVTGRVDIVQALLKHKAAHMDKTRHGYTPLHLAAKDGHVEVLNVLLQEGADVEAKTRFKFTPLHFAAQQGLLSSIESLLSRNAEVNVKDQNHFTPLHLAAMKGHNDAVLTLLRHNAEINAQTTRGNTPLHFAAERGHWQVADTLLRNNANPEIKNNEGEKAFFICSLN